MTTTGIDLTPPAVLDRAANVIQAYGHAKEDYKNSDGYCSAGAIATACGLVASDWLDGTDIGQTGREKRAGSLAALRALIHHVNPDSRPETMTRRQLIEHIALWNDDDQRTADQVVEAMRAAAREVTHA